ncbi:MAG: hypothetical protein JSU95_03245 [Betaproteobacteria bacterium]|nr:MAG: hypothetical protein JSU95_03245 [Betaproteobacteria bacterium]
MDFRLRAFVFSVCFAAMSAFTIAAHADDDDDRYFNGKHENNNLGNGDLLCHAWD